MGWLKQLQGLLGQKKPPAQPTPPRVIPHENEPEIVVPELTPAQLTAALASDAPPLLLDVREMYEWRQVRMPAAYHIPMNDIPTRLAEVPQAQPLVVFCAHGSRSYSVAAWLIEQGYTASNLEGGITLWAARGGDVAQGEPPPA